MPNLFNQDRLIELLTKIQGAYQGAYSLRASRAISFLNAGSPAAAFYQGIQGLPDERLDAVERQDYATEVRLLKANLELQDKDQQLASEQSQVQTLQEQLTDK